MALMNPVDFSRVRLTGSFWEPRQESNRRVTLGIQYEHLVKTGRIASIDPGHKRGDRDAHHIFWDSDIAKWVESAAYSLSLERDAELEALIDGVVDLFAKCQAEDGYLNSWYNNVEPEKRWTNLRDCHELYCAGHLMEGAVAYFLATGKSRLLDIMCRYADHIDSVFGPGEGQAKGYCGHEELELALVKLYKATGNERYLRLASYFVDERGRQPHYFDAEAVKRGEEPGKWHFGTYEYNQAHLPVREQTRVVGHAVRAMYLYCGMADVARLTGDGTLLSALEGLWDDLCNKQMYVTGGIGPSQHNEGFTFHYDMPEETAYCETCAAIGLVFWASRMLQLTGESRYADVMERALYNGALAGISLAGDRFFYVNPMASLGGHHRQEWFGCACCPGNISRLIASVGSYVYSEGPDTAWVHSYAAGTGSLTLADGALGLRLRQETAYPWDGSVRITIEGLEASDQAPDEFALALRIPGWCRCAGLSMNGSPVDIGAEGVVRNGYAIIHRAWALGDTVELMLPMPVELVRANPRIRQAAGKAAIQRGPIVYCLEGIDNNGVDPLSRISVPEGTDFKAEFEPGLLGGVVVIRGEASIQAVGDWDSVPYRAARPGESKGTFMAVPYYAWDNREPGAMTVWVREA